MYSRPFQGCAANIQQKASHLHVPVAIDERAQAVITASSNREKICPSWSGDVSAAASSDRGELRCWTTPQLFFRTSEW